MLIPRAVLLRRSEAYYYDQGILPAEEWPSFIDALRQPLPTTFRFTAGKATTRQHLEQMRDRWSVELKDIEWEGEKVPPPQPLEWFPEGLAWQIDVRKAVLRKQEAFKNFQRFLVNETEVGSISRQEAVSMIPPLFLDVKQEHLVLDMCAAPGSKTAQLIEAIHSPNTSSPDQYDPCPPGMVMANDSDQKRAYMLVHQASRLPSPNLIVTNVDASSWPKVTVPWAASGSSAEEVQARDLKFDRVLADVPCSGDGTMRKNVSIWREWNANNAMGLHSLQLRILLRGLNALRPGGRLVYSTCSMNPVENEAVISAALRECGADPASGQEGSVKVVDVSSSLPQLKRRKGLTTWEVAPGQGRHLFAGSESNMQPKQAPQHGQGKSDADKSGAEDPSAEDSLDAAANEAKAAAEDAPSEEDPAGSTERRAKLPSIPWVDSWQRLNELDRSLASRTPKSLWPNGDEAQLGIENCMRVYPHQQNTGGFFITVLEKRGDVNTESLSAGMARAMDALDAGAEQPSYPGALPAPGKKRALSPGSSDEASASKAEPKRSKTKDEKAAPAEETDAVPEAPKTYVKPDNHAADRERKHQQQRKEDSGFGLPGGTPYKEDPFAFVPRENDQVQRIHSFFGLNASFPSRNLVVRNPDAVPLRSIYLTSSSTRALLTGGGPGAGRHPSLNPMKLRVLNAGVKAFSKQDSNKGGELECKWRIVADGLPPLLPFLSPDNVVAAQLSDLAYLLSEYYPFVDSMPPGSFSAKMKEAKIGSYIMAVQPGSHGDAEIHQTLHLPVWRAWTSINVMLDKAERIALSMRVFGSDLSATARQQAEEAGRKRNADFAAATAAAASAKPSSAVDAPTETAASAVEPSATVDKAEEAADAKREEQIETQLKEEVAEDAAADVKAQQA